MRHEEPRIEERSKRIEQELKELGDRSQLKSDDWAKEWAGTYYTGDGLGMNAVIRIAPKGGVAYTWHGCMGLYDANHGDIVETFPDGLRVKLVIPPDLSTYEFMSERLYFVKWGDRRYLVPEAQMQKLVNNYNEGGFAREEMYSIPRRIVGENWHARTPVPPGKPELPARYAKLLLGNPVTIKITAVKKHQPRTVTGPVKLAEFELDLDAGTDKGVFVGMEIPYRSGLSFGQVEVESAAEHTSKGRLRVFYGETGAPGEIKAGDTLRLGATEPEVPPEPNQKP
jgi:hypothetical protein